MYIKPCRVKALPATKFLTKPRTSVHIVTTTTKDNQDKASKQPIMSTEKQFDNLHTEMFDLGIKNRREVVGDSYVDAALKNGSSEFSYPGQQLVTE